MPAVVQTSAAELLQELEQQLRANFPTIAATLQPGLSDAEITALETQGGFKLSEDLRAFYRWHNGMQTNTTLTFITGHYFPSLQSVVADHKATVQSRPNTAAQRVAANLFTAHTAGWLEILPDRAGDGFVYDTKRKDADGAFFYHFTEGSEFVYFPAFRNFLAATVESIKSGAYHPDKDGRSMEEDFAKVEAIWNKFGSRPSSTQ